MQSDLALIRLLQLVSPGLPIGMYSYSQGLERAIHDGWLSNASEVGEWLTGVLEQVLGKVDAPILLRLYQSWYQNDFVAVTQWSQMLCACRETQELRTEDRQTGQALSKLLIKLEVTDAEYWQRHPDSTLATLFSLAAVRWQIADSVALTGYLWGWLENQVLCAVKLVPMGQVAGQLLLKSMGEQLPGIVQQARLLTDEEIGGSCFGLALSSSRHEMQYSRLFRS
jgi:urease accessory protein